MYFRVAIVTATLTSALTTVGAAGVAGADPVESVTCNFTLSEPSVVEVSGVQMVTATVSPAACTGLTKPISSQVCLSTPGTAGRCVEKPGYSTAQVYLSPYQPGVAYTARGRGCSAQTRPPMPICTTVGPTTAVL